MILNKLSKNEEVVISTAINYVWLDCTLRNLVKAIEVIQAVQDYGNDEKNAVCAICEVVKAMLPTERQIERFLGKNTDSIEEETKAQGRVLFGETELLF
jgi:hypothetical protein